MNYMKRSQKFTLIEEVFFQLLMDLPSFFGIVQIQNYLHKPSQHLYAQS